MRAILIAEKPSLMREIEAVYKKIKGGLGFEIDFLAQAGHLVGLKTPDLVDKKYEKWKLENFPIDVPYEYHVLSGKEKLVKDIKVAVHSGKYDCVIHAGDPDGEGELLVRLVLSYVGNKLPVKRFWTNDLTFGAIEKALKGLSSDSDYDRIYDAALLRQHLDYQFGMNLTGVSTLRCGALLKTGRVKAVIVERIVKREREIQNFKDSSKFKHAFTYMGCEFSGENEYETDANAMVGLPKGNSAEVTEAVEKKSKRKAPKLYKLSTLQTDAHNRYKINGKDVLTTVQSLYEKKFVSYPRTDCEYISSHIDAEKILTNLAHLVSVPNGYLTNPATIMADKTYANDKVIATEGHTAIIPTGVVPTGLSGYEEKIYDMIVRRFFAIFSPEKETRTVTVKAVAEEEEYTYSETEDLDAGWELMLNPAYKIRTLPKVAFKKGEISPVDFFVKEIKAKPPARYNSGSLIKALDTPDDYIDANGKKLKYKIGTPATRSNIIEECIKCGYFLVDKNGTYSPTDLAFYLIDTLGDLPVFDITTSAKWEELFERVRTGEKSSTALEADMMAQLHNIIADIKSRSITPMVRQGTPSAKTGQGTCPLCGGTIFENSKAFSCSNWNKNPKCDFTIWKNWIMGVTFTKADVNKLAAGKEITKDVTSKAGKTWKQKLCYNKAEKKVDFAK